MVDLARLSPSVDLSEAIDIFRAGVPDIEDGDDDHIGVDDVATLQGAASNPNPDAAAAAAAAPWESSTAEPEVP